MENEQILAGNKLIAEFMGAYYCNDDRNAYPDGYWMCSDEFIELPYNINDFKFHSSWDWLMSVVEQIENINIRYNGYDFPKVKFQGDHVEIFAYATYRGTSFYWKKWYSLTGTFNNHVHQVDTKIEAVWLAVVEFLKWYKNN